MDELPKYMKFCYKALLDVYSEAEKSLAMEDGKLYPLDYAKEAVYKNKYSESLKY